MDAIVGERLAMFETAGSLKDGKRAWMLARIPKGIRAAGDDVVEPYVLLTNSHDGSMALRMFPTTIRVVCQNTLNLALRQAGESGLTIYHRESLQQRVEEAKVLLGLISERVDQSPTGQC